MAAFCSNAVFASDDNEISLFDSTGAAEAYIALDDEMTIYLWGGKPVAYLERDDDGYDVYGFNGEHLGWFVNGAIWGHDGKAVCAVKDMLPSAKFESFKGFKQFKAFKSFTKFAPAQPSFSGSFGDIPCKFLLFEGAK